MDNIGIDKRRKMKKDMKKWVGLRVELRMNLRLKIIKLKIRNIDIEHISTNCTNYDHIFVILPVDESID